MKYKTTEEALMACFGTTTPEETTANHNKFIKFICDNDETKVKALVKAARIHAKKKADAEFIENLDSKTKEVIDIIREEIQGEFV